MNYQHQPVLLKEVMAQLPLQSGDYVIDGTLGGGGYTIKLAQAVGPSGKVLAIDLDPLAQDHAKALIKEHGLGNIILVQDNFANLSDIVQKYLPNAKFQAIVLDLGLSSAQLADQSRGFSFKNKAPLNMAFGKNNEETKNIVNRYPADKLIAIIKDYGEERWAKRIAQAIVQARQQQPVTTTQQLTDIIAQAVPVAYRHNRIHFATRTWQALRIATNDELTNLRKFLPQAVQLLAHGGQLAIVSFHSLEDRLVKQFFQQEAKDCLCPPNAPVCQCHHQAQLKIINKKVIKPSQEEINSNPRARSAKLRLAEKI